jgi:type IV secretion system protein VirD4
MAQLYDGRNFPQYRYKDCLMEVEMSSRYAPPDSPAAYLYLPVSQTQIERTMLRVGINNYGDLCLRFLESSLPKEIDAALNFENENLSDLNELCHAAGQLSPADREKLGAVVLLVRPEQASEIANLAKNLEQFDYVPKVRTPEEYGKHIIIESGHFEYDENLVRYIDFAKYGTERMVQEQGQFVDRGYGYNISVIDLRNPTRSDGNNLLHLVNKYMDEYRKDERNLAAKAKAEKYAKIISKTIINSSGDSANYGQNAFFYDAAEGLLTSVILLLAEFLPPDDEHPEERRHIISVFKMVQELLEPSNVRGKSQFQLLMAKLPPDHKAKWFAGAALNSSDQAMASVMSTVLSRLNAFLDSEMEQILCFDTAIDAEKFCNTKSAIFIVLPEEDLTKYFMVSLMIQQLYREILSVADEHGGKLPNRVVFYCDELGTIPPIESLQLIFSASRSRRLLMVPIIQSFGQLQKNYGKEGSEIIVDNCQCTIFGGFAPNSQTAEVLSKALGSRTVMSGSISRSKNDPSQSLQMMERPLMMPDELKSLPKGQFIVMKTGTHPMQTRLRLFLDWGITFDNVYEVPEKAERKVAYADKDELERRIVTRYHSDKAVENVPVSDKRTQASMSQQQSNYSLRDSKARQRQRSQSQEDKV